MDGRCFVSTCMHFREGKEICLSGLLKFTCSFIFFLDILCSDFLESLLVAWQPFNDGSNTQGNYCTHGQEMALLIITWKTTTWLFKLSVISSPHLSHLTPWFPFSRGHSAMKNSVPLVKQTFNQSVFPKPNLNQWQIWWQTGETH